MFRLLKKLFSPSQTEAKVEISPVLTVGDEYNSAREKLKEATSLKKEKRYIEACEKLKDAYSSPGAQDLMVKERLRLPMYLQLAGRADEGWRILNEMNIHYTDVFSQAEIANQMRVFLQKEKNYTQAVLFALWSICKEVERDKENIQESIRLADELNSLPDELYLPDKYAFLRDGRNEKAYGKTSKGSPITDPAHKMFRDRIEDSTSKKVILERVFPLLKKLKKENLSDTISGEASRYLKSTQRYDLRELRDILNRTLTSNQK